MQDGNDKQQQLDEVRVDPTGTALTTQQGVRVDHTDDSLTVGERGPTLLFWNSMSDWEREHIVAAFRFELGKCDHMHVREAVVEQLNHVDHRLATQVAEGIGVKPPAGDPQPNHGRSSPALSQANTTKDSITSRKVAALVADGVAGGPINMLIDTLRAQGAITELLGPTDGSAHTSAGHDLPVDRTITTMASVLYDGIVVPGGIEGVSALSADGYAVHFVAEAVTHAKAVAAIGDGTRLLDRVAAGAIRVAADGDDVVVDRGVVSAASGEGATTGRLHRRVHRGPRRAPRLAATPSRHPGLMKDGSRRGARSSASNTVLCRPGCATTALRNRRRSRLQWMTTDACW